jgi:hypothetical protein
MLASTIMRRPITEAGASSRTPLRTFRRQTLKPDSSQDTK